MFYSEVLFDERPMLSCSCLTVVQRRVDTVKQREASHLVQTERESIRANPLARRRIEGLLIAHRFIPVPERPAQLTSAACRCAGVRVQIRFQ